MKPDLSIIIPVFNGQSYIQACLDNILSQNRATEFEIIVVNDGSTDGSLKIIHDYAMRHDNIIPIHQQNQGVSNARNNAIDIANGKYITFTDVDDLVGVSYDSIKDSFNNVRTSAYNTLRVSTKYLKSVEEINYRFEKDYFIKQLSAAEKTKADIALAGKFTVNYDNIYTCQHVYLEDSLYSNSAKEKTTLIKHADMRESANFALYRHDFLNKNNIRFQSGMHLDEDILFCMHAIVFANKVATVSGATYLYHRHANTASNLSGRINRNYRYTTANIQRYSAFLSLVSENKKYASLFNTYLREFALLTDNITGLRSNFPCAMCYKCPKKTCDGCFVKDGEITRIKGNLAEFLPSFLQQTQKLR